MLFTELASDFGGELVVGGGPFREPPTVMQSTVDVHQNPSLYRHSSTLLLLQDASGNDIINYIEPID